MREAFEKKNLMKLACSVIVIYFLAPSLDQSQAPFVSFIFALVLILSTKLAWDKEHIIRYSSFILIDMLTYFILFDEQPWDFLFHGGIYDSTPIPLIGCSIIMAFAGWLLLRTWKDRFIYICITLGLQIPIAVFVGTDTLQIFFSEFSQTLHFVDYYSGGLQAWQFEWMLTYYLPIYFLSHRKSR